MTNHPTRHTTPGICKPGFEGTDCNTVKSVDGGTGSDGDFIKRSGDHYINSPCVNALRLGGAVVALLCCQGVNA